MRMIVVVVVDMITTPSELLAKVPQGHHPGEGVQMNPAGRVHSAAISFEARSSWRGVLST
jgi:hypothetical protein